MKKPSLLHENAEAVTNAYKLLLKESLSKAHQRSGDFHKIISEVRKKSAELENFSEHEAAKIENYLKRDLIDAASYLNKTGQELRDWLGFDLALIERELWERFSLAVDKTTLELLQLKQNAANAKYYTGELTGIGTLICDQCDRQLHFHKPGHIPPCPGCNGTGFHRQHF
jgi:hypothetical protein